MSAPKERLLAELKQIEFVKVFTKKDEVGRFAAEVRVHADSDKNAPGFLPAQVYEDAANSGNLYVAALEDGGALAYAGHLLFGGVYPNARVFQLYIKRQCRKYGIARRLLAALVEVLERECWLSVRAHVANDLQEANAAWERLGFSTIRQKPGRGSRQRVLNIRVKALRTPSLFGTPEDILATELQITTAFPVRTPVYLIDLNVFFDVYKRRPRAEYSAHVIAAGLRNLALIVIADEFVNELKRTSRTGSPDPALEFALELPRLPSPPSEKLNGILPELAKIVFPGRALSDQDKSDLVHLATAIHHNANGFITAENAIVRAHEQISSLYGIRVLHVSRFSELAQASTVDLSPLQNRISDWTLRISKPDKQTITSLDELFNEISVPDHFRRDFCEENTLASSRRAAAVTSESQILCAVTWDARSGLQSVIEARLISNEDHPSFETGVDAALLFLVNKIATDGPVLVRLEVPGANLMSLQICESRGFRQRSRTAQTVVLDKIAVGGVLDENRWPGFRAWARSVAGIQFSERLPDFVGELTNVNFSGANGRESAISLTAFESLAWPTIVLAGGRGGAMAPIRAEFSSALLDASPQLKLTPNEGPKLLPEKIYYSSAKNSKILKSGIPVIFYESGSGTGRSCAVGLARILQTTVTSKSAIPKRLLQHGVFEPDDIDQIGTQERIAVTTFDNLMLFKNPVSFRKLQQLRCTGNQNLISSFPLSFEQLRAVVQEGQARV